MQGKGDQLAAIRAMEAQARKDLAQIAQQDKLLDAEQERFIEAIFTSYDRDQSGMVSGMEFQKAIEAGSMRFGGKAVAWDPVLFPKVFDKMDSSDDGQVTRDELREGLQLLNGSKIFNEMDQDDTGLLNFKEWRTAVMKINKDWNDGDAQEVFKQYDKSGDGVMCFDEFLAACSEMYKMFHINSVQVRVDKVKKEIEWWEKKVRELLSGVDFHQKRLGDAKGRRDGHADSHGNKRDELLEHSNFLKPRRDMIGGHKEQLDLLGMSLEEQKSTFREYKKDLDKAFRNKGWVACKEISAELLRLKLSIDDIEGRHHTMNKKFEQVELEISDRHVEHATADIELRHLEELLREAEAHHDEIEAAHGGHMGELREAEVKFTGLKQHLRALELEGAQAELQLVMQQLDKSLDDLRKMNNDILQQCDNFKMYFKQKSFKETGLVGDRLVALQETTDNEELLRDALLEKVNEHKVNTQNIMGSIKAEGGLKSMSGNMFIKKDDGRGRY